MKIKRVTVKKNERGLLLRNGDFERVLQPGTPMATQTPPPVATSNSSTLSWV